MQELHPEAFEPGTLVIFARPAVAGRCKTRLIPGYGELGALSLAEAFLLDTYQLALGSGAWRIVVSLAETGTIPELTPPPEVWVQGPGDLGERMTAAAERALSEGASWVILLGSDSPGLPRLFVQQAIELLRRGHDAVLGPASDGGFYLLGLRRCPEALLENLVWSSSNTCAATLQRLEEWGLWPVLLSEWFDVDRPEDVERLRAGIGSGRIAAPHSEHALRKVVPKR